MQIRFYVLCSWHVYFLKFIFIVFFFSCRPTVIHRFFIKSTIEERMYDMLSNVKKTRPVTDRSDTTLTTADLFSLFGEVPLSESHSNISEEILPSMSNTATDRSEIQQRCAMAALSRLSEPVTVHPDLPFVTTDDL